MVVTIEMRFLTGRFHATPWNHQVNEGVVEWPPSPWRILRTLVAVYYQMPDRPDPEALAQLLAALSTLVPEFVLPPVTTAHTRHYMPWRNEGKFSTTKVLDTFVVMDRADTQLARSAPMPTSSASTAIEPVSTAATSPDAASTGSASTDPMSSPAIAWVSWPELQLGEADLALLRRLCGEVMYFGRSQSWCEWAVTTAGVPPGDRPGVLARVDHGEPEAAGETVPVLVPLSPQRFADFVATLAQVPRPKRAKWQVPTTLLTALAWDVGTLRQQGWGGVPGAEWVTYRLQPLRASWRSPRRSVPRRRSLSAQGATGGRSPVRSPQALAIASDPMVARFELRGRLPRLTDALWVGERFRQGLMKRAGEAASVFSGRQDELALQGQRHAWYWPEDADGDGLIDRVWVFAAAGFVPEEVQVLQSLRRVWDGRGFEIETRLGAVEPLARVRSQVGGLFGSSAVWRSRTPLVLPRHPKTVSVLDPLTGERRRVPKLDPLTQRPIDGLEDQVIRLLGLLPPELGLTLEPLRVAVIGPQRAGLRLDWARFRRSRLSGQGRRSDGRGYGVELVFPQPVAGPIALGYGAHFGLGLFGPVPLDGADG